MNQDQGLKSSILLKLEIFTQGTEHIPLQNYIA